MLTPSHLGHSDQSNWLNIS